MGKKATPDSGTIKVWSSIITVTFAIIGGIFGAITWLDGAYASEAEVTAQLSPLNTKIELIQVAQSEFSSEVRELRKDRIRDQIRGIKKEKYGIKQLIEANKAKSYDHERLDDLNIDLTDLTDRLHSIE